MHQVETGVLHGGRFLRLALALVVMAAIAPAGVSAALPAVPLGPSPQTGTIATTHHAGDVDAYYVDLAAGQVLSLEATYEGWMSVYAMTPDDDPGGSTRISSSYAGDERNPSDERYLTVHAEVAGRYTIYVHTFSQATYSLAYTIVSGAVDDFIPGAPLPASPVSGSFQLSGDTRDIYAVDLLPGERITATVTNLDCNLFMLQPGTGRVLGSTAISDTGQRTGKFSFLVPPGGGGTYHIVVYNQRHSWAPVAEGPYSLIWKVDEPLVHRLAGDDRYFTSIAATRSSFASSSVAVIATGRLFPDALAASALAGVLEAPLVLEGGSIAEYISMTAIELRRLGVSDIYIIGGPAAISTAHEDAYLQAGFNVTRLGGQDRYETSHLVADEVARRVIEGGGSVETAFLVRGDDFADALAAGPYAYSQRMPVLLTKTGSLNGLAAGFIETHGIEDVVVVGGESAVSADVVDAASALNGGATAVERISGPDRYASAAALAAYAVDDRTWATWDYVGVATGRSFPDGLSASAAMGSRGGVLLLTGPTSLPTATVTAMEANISDIRMALVFGGPVVIADGVVAQIGALFP